jgi:hypothetical protein
MECPECGYDVEDGANFCPQCRHAFRETGPAFGSLVPDPAVDSPVHAPGNDEIPEGFSGKELRYLKVQLLQPSLFVVAGVAITGYLTVPQVQNYSFEAFGHSFPSGGAMCVLAGIVVGGIFYWGMSARLAKFRSPLIPFSGFSSFACHFHVPFPHP